MSGTQMFNSAIQSSKQQLSIVCAQNIRFLLSDTLLQQMADSMTK